MHDIKISIEKLQELFGTITISIHDGFPTKENIIPKTKYCKPHKYIKNKTYIFSLNSWDYWGKTYCVCVGLWIGKKLIWSSYDDFGFYYMKYGDELTINFNECKYL